MKNLLILVLASVLSFPAFSQSDYTEAELKQKCDSILEEGNLLYRHEAAAWRFTDLYQNNQVLIGSAGGYLAYQQGDSIKCILTDREAKECIFEAAFINETFLCYTHENKRELSAYETELLSARRSIWKELSEKKIGISQYAGFTPNWILIPFENGYKLYSICGTNRKGVIPFGNDYLFVANKQGELQTWRKLHSRPIPAEVTNDMKFITTAIHSHLRQEPFITATDICTFRLYYDQTGTTEFSVYSPALSLYFTYHLSTNTITFSKELKPHTVEPQA